jgi:hypothetical protein
MVIRVRDPYSPEPVASNTLGIAELRFQWRAFVARVATDPSSDNGLHELGFEVKRADPVIVRIGNQKRPSFVEFEAFDADAMEIADREASRVIEMRPETWSTITATDRCAIGVRLRHAKTWLEVPNNGCDGATLEFHFPYTMWFGIIQCLPSVRDCNRRGVFSRSRSWK